MQTTDPEAPETQVPAYDQTPFLGGEESSEENPPAEAEPGESPTAGPAPNPDTDDSTAETPESALEALMREPRRRRLLVAAGAVVLVLLLVPFLLFWQVRRDAAVLRSELDGLRSQARRSEVLLQKATILRARAELQALRQTLPADLGLEVEKADGILSGVDERLKAIP